VTGASSRNNQGLIFTSPIMSGIPGLLSIAQAGLAYAVPGANTLKDGNRYILKIADLSSPVGSLLAPNANRLVTIYLPQYNIAWPSYLAIRRRDNPYLYVRFPRQLRRLAEELWRMGTPIPVVVIIPTLPMTLGNLKDGLRSRGGDGPAPVQNRPASAGLGGQAPQDMQEG